MSKRSKIRCIGILTSGGDCPGLNAAIRAVTKAALGTYGIRVVGILDGFRGLVENRTILLDDQAASEDLLDLCAEAVVKVVDIETCYLKPQVRQYIEARRA